MVIGRVAPQCNPGSQPKERSSVMKNNEESKQEQLPHSNSPSRKKPYVAPKITSKIGSGESAIGCESLSRRSRCRRPSRSLGEQPLRFGFLYQGIIDFPRVAMLGSLVWVPRGLEFWDIKPQTIPRGLPSPQFLNFLGSVGTQSVLHWCFTGRRGR